MKIFKAAFFSVVNLGVFGPVTASSLHARAHSFDGGQRPNHSSSHEDSSSDHEDLKNYKPCGCLDCTQDVLTRNAGGFTCAERIDYLINGPHQLDEEEACIRVGRLEFPSIAKECGACDPGRCDDKELPGEEIPSTYCGCKHCDHHIWNRDTADSYSCGARISYLKDFEGLPMEEACNIVGGHEFPDEDTQCGFCDSARCKPIRGDGEYTCGCSRCVEAVWNLDAGNGKTCGESIEHLLKTQPNKYPNEKDACREVSEKFPSTCFTNCHPDKCDDPLTARADLYCFPKFEDRTRFRNMFGNFTVEVKDSTNEEHGICGPQNNVFSTRTVSNASNKSLKLQFKKVGDRWAGSEVRIRRPEVGMPIRYGTFKFSVKSIRVRNAITGEVSSRGVLPPSLVLSMHTWDATENYAIHEQFNHQVSIDISQFDQSHGPDARFAVQPATEFNTHKFYTKKGLTYKQAPRIYQFDWNPGKIEFSANTGGESSERFLYSSRRALDAGNPDFTQCLPADVELRISLWNLYGSLPPTHMADKEDDIVEVVIDDVDYVPSGLEHVPDGDACSKDCHCGPTSQCLGHKCTPKASQYQTIEQWYAAQSGSKGGGEAGPSAQARAGRMIFAFAVAALSMMAYRRMRSRKQIAEVDVEGTKFASSGVTA